MFLADSTYGNPYAPPVTDLPAPPIGAVDDAGIEAETIRWANLKHETSVRSIGLLYYLGAFSLLAMTVSSSIGLARVVGAHASAEAIGEAVGVAVVSLLFAVGSFFMGRGLRNLKRWARIPVCILQGFGLLGFPGGTLLSVYILYLLLGKKGRIVFSDGYQEVIRRTPHIKYKTSIVVWVLLAILLLTLVAVFVIPSLGL